VSPTKPAIGAAIAMASTAMTKSLFALIDERPSALKSMLRRLHGFGAQRAFPTYF
jgi:hypothetical protein